MSILKSLARRQLLACCLALLAPATGAAAADCNGNGVDDAGDIAARFHLASAPRYPAGEATSMAAADLDRDGDLDLAAGATGLVSVLRNLGDGTFEAARDLPAPGPRRSIVAADLDGDGSPDLAAAGAECGSGACAAVISVLLNQGDGTFGPAFSHAASAPAESILAADLDGDSRPDLVTLGNDFTGPAARASILVLLNNGNGTFALTTAHEASEGLASLIASDLDRDGRPDLAVVNSTGVLVLFNDGQGAFGTPATIPVGEMMVSLAAADLDGNRWTDLAVTRAICGGGGACAGAVVALVNNRDRTFRATNYPTGGLPTHVLADDLSGDGRADLATANGDGSFEVRLNAGQGSFLAASTHGDSGGLAPVAARAADLDGDGRLDLITANGTASGVSVLKNRGGGTFAAVRHYAAGGVPSALAVADLDGDLRLDAVVLAADRSAFPPVRVAVLLNRGGGALEAATNHAVDSGPSSVLAADLDADGRLDLATPNLRRSVSVLLNAGGSFQPAAHYTGPMTLQEGRLTAADLSGDGKPDLAGTGGDSVSVLINRGDGTFHDPTAYTVRPRVHAVLAADVDRDGRLDVVGVAGNSRLSLLYNQGGGNLHGEVTVPLQFVPNSLTALDLDGDGEAEIQTANVWGRPFVLLRRGEGAYEMPMEAVDNARALAADFEGDGDLDLAVMVPGVLSVYFTGESGTFGRRTDLGPPPSFPAELAAADLDGDGLLDVAAVSADAVAVWIHIDPRNGAFAPAASYPVPARALSLIAADLDLDGFRDLAAASAWTLSGSLTVLLNRGDGSFREPVIFPVGGSGIVGFRNVLAADVDGDGKPDLVSADLTGLEGTDLTQGVTVLSNLTLPAASRDGNRNGVPDECEPGSFHRGDPNHDGRSDATDAVALLDFLFLRGADFPCRESADANDDEALDVADPVFLLFYLFKDGSPPPYPGPPGTPCGLDLDPRGQLDCSNYERC